MKLCPKCQKQFTDDANFCPVDAARLVPLESRTVAADSIAARFELGARLGGTRTGTVVRATDKTTGQPAAVKIIAPAVVALPGLAQRLERELKQLERVQSAGVAKVLASGKRGDDSWVALELLDGAQTLADAISARGPIMVEQAAHLIEVVGEALIEAAQVGVVHRDLAPKNVLFAGVDVKLINFSLPVPTGDHAPAVPGVREFVAPEQHDGKPVDQRSNLYSLGALYYFVLTGQTIQVDAAGAIKPPSSLAPVPAPVEAVILRALDRSPTKRFLTVRQFVDEVNRVGHGEVIDLKSTQPLGRAGKPRAELVQTLLGVRGGGIVAPNAPMIPSTVGGVVAPSAGAAGHVGAVASTVSAGAASAGGPAMPAPLPPQILSPDRSPWAPPATAPPNGPAPMPPAAPTLPAPAPVVAAPAVAVAAGPPAGVSSPVVAPPAVAASGKKSKSKGKANEDPKGKFRETMWFKKGELDAQAAQAAAEEHAVTGNEVATDKADSLPIDERYKDDGTLSRSDKEKYSLRTGGTMMTAAMRDSGSNAAMSNKISEDALIGEMKGGRNLVIALLAIGLVVVGLIIFVIVR
jgi:eukaryotic-like serine/threonine-protein kinase